MTNETENETQSIAGERLKSFIERVERLNYELDEIKEDVKETYSEAKGVGFDVKIIREIVKLRKKDKEKRNEERELIDLYLSAIGDV